MLADTPEIGGALVTHAHSMIDNQGRTSLPRDGTGPPSGWLRVLCLLLLIWEPIAFAAAAAGAFNAIAVRGVPVVAVLLVRLIATALCVAAGRALLDRRPSALALAKTALVLSAVVQTVAYVTPWFPSNRLPGLTSFYVIGTVLYYGAWLIYLARSRRVQRLYT
jgi:hypothetical protein